jgi:hypothetical protein
MAVVWKVGHSHAIWVCAALLVGVTAGCQQTSQVSYRRLIEHQALIDFSGLKPVEAIESTKVHAAVPRNWTMLAPTNTPLYTHQQWRSPSTKTGFGVAHLRLPLPLSTKMFLWLAKREYSKRGDDGRIISEWTDDLGRPWFEAENFKYRVRGYVVVNGFQAWVIYFGHKSKLPPDPAELSLAARAADSIVPDIGRSKSANPSAPAKPAEAVARRQ